MSLFQIQGLTHYFGGLRAVHNFNVTLEGGELMGLIGPNGAGKTTVFNLVCGVYRPTQGDIRLNGTSLPGRYPHQVSSLGIARTFQNIRLWAEMTVLENLNVAQHCHLGYGLADLFIKTKTFRQREGEIYRVSREMLEVLELKDVAHEVPKNLPYGIQRRVEIGRALTMKPKLLLLDEPAAGLNSAEVVGLMRLIQWIQEEFHLTVWLIEHQMKVVMNICTWIQVLDFGATIAEGTPDDIRQNKRVIDAYLGEEVH
ncbi:MAG: transporter related [Deltaproteobacteria bacterium]|jgi:branched-chain amino acid transport system ATP-binding protein|nr:transporter related [Deltaproteobacteria bacterium]